MEYPNYYWGATQDEKKNDSTTLFNSTDVTVNNNVIRFCSGVTHESVAKFNAELQKLDILLQQQTIRYETEPLRIKLYISSYGGSVFAGTSAMDNILNCTSPIDTIVDGQVASAGTFLSIVGNRRYMHKHSYMLIHQLSSSFWGKMNEFEDNIKNLNEFHKLVKNMYMTHANVPESKLEEILKHDLWWDAPTCLEYGLIDFIL